MQQEQGEGRGAFGLAQVFALVEGGWRPALALTGRRQAEEAEAARLRAAGRGTRAQAFGGELGLGGDGGLVERG